MLLIVSSHPVQYQVPIWRILSQRMNMPVHVMYLTKQGVSNDYDPEFNISLKWDIDMLDGYNFSHIKDAVPTLGSFFYSRISSLGLKDIKNFMTTNRVQYVMIQGWNIFAYYQIVNFVKRNTKAKIILRGEGTNLYKNRIFSNLIRTFILRNFFNKIDKFLYIGEANRQLYEDFSIEKDKLIFSPYSIDNKRFRDQLNLITNKEKKLIRKELLIDEDSVVVSFFGKLINKKRPLDIIHAAKILENTISKKIHIVFVGDGELFDEIIANSDCKYSKRLLATKMHRIQNHEAPKTSLLGFLNQTEITKAYSISNIIVLPSDQNETWGLVVNEGMACGVVPVVSNRVGSSYDLVDPLSNKLIFDYADIDSLAKSLKFAIDNYPLLKEKVNKIIEQYTFDRVVESIKIATS